jgi:hypothetical protein
LRIVTAIAIYDISHSLRNAPVKSFSARAGPTAASISPIKNQSWGKAFFSYPFTASSTALGLK